MRGVLRGLGTTLRTHFSKPVTIQYPDEKAPLAERFRGFPALLWDDEVGESKCTGCATCARSCPTQVIKVTAKDNEKFQEGKSKRRRIVDSYFLNLAGCIQCGICVEVCPFDANEMSHVHELADYSREGLVLDVERLHRMSKSKGR